MINSVLSLWNEKRDEVIAYSVVILTVLIAYVMYSLNPRVKRFVDRVGNNLYVRPPLIIAVSLWTITLGVIAVIAIVIAIVVAK